MGGTSVDLVGCFVRVRFEGCIYVYFRVFSVFCVGFGRY